VLTLDDDAAPPVLALDPVARAVPLNSVLDGAAPVSLVVEAAPVPLAVDVAPVPLPSNPAVTVTGKKVISDAASVVVDTPGKFAADPPNDSMHTPPAERVNVQSTEAVKSGTI
jgi:hypothetical protein